MQLTKGLTPQSQAFFYLQQGLLDLDRGHYDEALKHYKEADRVFSGWWLIDEHIAEIYRLKGQIDVALEIYERVVAETGNPEYMDALALIALDKGNKNLAKIWSDRARASYQEQLAKFPEATYGHAIQHYLTFGSSEEALALAKKNYDLRPNGEAQTYLIDAYIKAGQLKCAEMVLNDVLESPWHTAYLDEVAAKVYYARGMVKSLVGEVIIRESDANLVDRSVFDSSAWVDKGLIDEGVRLEMADSLIERSLLDGKMREEVIMLLGSPTKTGYFKEWDFVYWLGPERGFISIDSEWLVIRFGPDDKVTEYQLVRD